MAPTEIPLKMKVFIFFVMFVSCNLMARDYPYKIQYDKIVGKLPNDTEGSEKLATLMLEKAKSEKNDEYIAKAYFLLGAIKYYNSRYYISNQFYTKALATDYAKKNNKFREYCLNNRGANFDFLNRIPEALKDFNTSLRIAETRKDSTAVAETLINIALLDVKAKRFSDAEKTNREVLKYFLSKKDTANISLCYQNLGLLFKEQDKFRLALDNCKNALFYHRAAGYQYGVIQTLFTIAEIYSLQDKIAESDSCFLKALEILKSAKFDMETMEAHIYVHLASNRIEKSEYSQAEKYLGLAYSLFKRTGMTENMGIYYFVSMDYYSRTGNFKAYKKKQQEYIEYTERKEAEKTLDKYNELKSFYGYDQKEQRIRDQESQISIMKMKIFYSSLIIILVSALLIVITYYYKETKKYVKTLYDSNVKSLSLKSDSYVTDTTDMYAALYNKILDLMKEERLYLNPDISISDLGRRMGTNSKYISQAINKYGNHNFNSFINAYRIDEAKRIIIRNGNSIALKVISAEVGFNNHTTFYRQFKDITGLSPTDFVEMSTKNLMDQVPKMT